MKIRLDFVTNSSSSSFVAYGIYDEELAEQIKELIRAYDANPINGLGWISADCGIISVTRKLEDIAWSGYYIFSTLEDDIDGRNEKQIAADEKKALTASMVINAFDGFFTSNFPTDDVKKRLTQAVREKGVKCRIYVDQTDGYCPQDFSCDADIVANRLGKTLPKPDEFIIEKGVLKRYNGKQTSIVIPDTVKSIGNEAFKGCKKIKSVTMGESVTAIGKQAFYECVSLTEVVLPETIKRIGVGAFKYCSSLVSFKIPSAVKSIAGDTFKHCTSLENVILHDAVTGIGEDAFCDTNLKHITLGKSLSRISEYAFCGCRSLKTVFIPELVDYIPDNVFAGCDSLECIDVSEDNNAYKSVDGNLYFKDESTLVKYAVGKKDSSFEVPDSVKTVGSHVFSGAKNLKSIYIPSSVQRFGEYTFKGCESLTIYCESESKPGTWHCTWNCIWNHADYVDGGYCPAVFGHKKR